MQYLRICCATGWLLLCAARGFSQVVDASTLSNKFVLGYQGWHACAGDGSALNLYIHWSHVGGVMPSSSDVTEDIWPDLSEFTAAELFATGFTLGSGQPAKAYSCYLTNTVLRHFKWMRDYGIDGVALQRFTKDVFSSAQWAALKNTNVVNVKLGAETYGRVFFIMYDISNDDPSLALSHLQSDWAYLAGTLHVTNSACYLKHRSKPLVCVWGMGINPGLAITTNNALAVINYFKGVGCTVMGGVPANWRTLNGDSQTNSGWLGVYRSFDVISPWTVGRYQNESQADGFKNSTIVPDIADCQSNNIDYLPVEFPGYSAHNLGGTGLNSIPRNGGRFYWRQIYNALSAGATMLYGAMFDEVDEGTALYKLAPTLNETPAAMPTNQYQFFALNVDGQSLPSDWYLRVTGQGTLTAHGAIPLTAILPITPTNTITVLAPNGGQTWTAGTTTTVTWSTTGIVGNVNIDLSTDGGDSFRSLVYNTANTGSRSLMVPYYASSNCLIRVVTTNGTPADWSDTVFTIRSTNSNASIELQPLWQLAPGSRSYLPAGGNNSERGLAYNATLDEVYVVYASPPSSANVLDGTTGAQKWALNLTGVSGGSFGLDKVGVTTDGVIYIGNVSAPGTNLFPTFKLYRWADSNAGTTPLVAYSGSAGFGLGIRVGDTFALRGCGTNTQVLVGARNTNGVCLLTTTNGTNFTARMITTDADGLQLSGALSFGAGNSIWGATNGLPPAQLVYDGSTLVATTAQAFSASVFPPACGAMSLDPANNLLCAVNLADGADQLNVYDLFNPTNSPLLLASWTFPGSSENSFGLGAIAFGGNRLYALDTNNGLLAFRSIFPGGATSLSAARIGSVVALSWPGAARGFYAEKKVNLSSGVWQPVCEAVSSATNVNAVTQALTGAAAFYRLNKP